MSSLSLLRNTDQEEIDGKDGTTLTVRGTEIGIGIGDMLNHIPYASGVQPTNTICANRTP